MDNLLTFKPYTLNLIHSNCKCELVNQQMQMSMFSRWKQSTLCQCKLNWPLVNSPVKIPVSWSPLNSYICI